MSEESENIVGCIKACIRSGGRRKEKSGRGGVRPGGWHDYLKSCMAELKNSPVFAIGTVYDGVNIKDGAVAARLRLKQCSKMYKKGGKAKHRPLGSDIEKETVQQVVEEQTPVAEAAVEAVKKPPKKRRKKAEKAKV